jgi:long-chain acyl-CoA synthetase
MSTTEFVALPDIARSGAARFGSLPALHRAEAAGSGGLTYEELWNAIRAGADNLRRNGLVDGDRVLLTAPPGPEWVAALLAILEANLVAVPLPPGFSADSIRAVAKHAEARTAVAAPGVAVPAERVIDIRGLLAPSTPHVTWERPTSADTALLVFTSGSTSNPRAVELTHGSILADLQSIRDVRSATPADAFLSMLPPTHLFELLCGTLGPLACGARVVYPGAILPNRLVDALRVERITQAMAVPALLAALGLDLRDSLESAGETWAPAAGAQPAELAAWIAKASEAEIATLRIAARARLGDALKSLFVGGAALDAAWARILGAVGVRLEVGYGLTEASPVVTLGVAGECPPGSVGRELPGIQVKIAPGGEILVRGPNVMRGYFRDPQATASALVDGWLHTGDRGRLDESGNLFIEGRLKEAMVAATGETIYPDEIEPCYASPQFAEWCVVPARAADGNDVPTLVVVAKDPGAPDDAILAEAARLRAAAESRLRVAAVRRIAGPLPRTATAKVRRRALGESLGGAS